MRNFSGYAADTEIPILERFGDLIVEIHISYCVENFTSDYENVSFGFEQHAVEKRILKLEYNKLKDGRKFGEWLSATIRPLESARARSSGKESVEKCRKLPEKPEERP